MGATWKDKEVQTFSQIKEINCFIFDIKVGNYTLGVCEHDAKIIKLQLNQTFNLLDHEGQ